MNNSDIYKKLDKLSDNDKELITLMGEVKVAIAKTQVQVEQNTYDLIENRRDWKEHMRKTNALERQAEVMRKIFLLISWTLGTAATIISVSAGFNKFF
jgi:hypothetical protein